jgi:ABC-2 type transport system permease protein
MNTTRTSNAPVGRRGPLWTVLAVAIGEARHTLMQPRLVVMLLLLPIIFSSVLAVFQTTEVSPVRMLYTGPDTPLAQAYRAQITRGRVELETANRRAANLVARSERDLWVRLPKDFDDQFKAGNVEVSVLAAPGNARAWDGEAALRAAAARLQVPLTAREIVRAQDPKASNAVLDDAQRRTQALLEKPVFRFTTTATSAERSSNALTATGASQTTPGMTLMFALLFGAQTGLALQRDRLTGTLARLFAAPVGWPVIVFGKLLGNTAILVAQLAAMMAFSGLVLGVRWGNIGALALPAIAFALAASAFGSLSAALTRTPAQLTSFSLLAVNVSSALGGLWWPISVTPQWMQTVARALPTFWGMDALQNVMLRGADFMTVLPHTLILLGFTAFFLSVGARVFKYE